MHALVRRVPAALALCLVVSCGDPPATTGPMSSVQTPPSGAGFAGTGGLANPPSHIPTTPATAGTGAQTPPTPMTPSPTAGTGATQPITGKLPCVVSNAVTANCGTCHGATPTGGAPMPLVTLADFHAPAKSMPTKQVHELVRLRIKDRARPMPPGGTMPASDIDMLDTWLAAGALAAPATEAECTPTTPTAPPDNSDGTYGALTPRPGEHCYEFSVHDGQTTDDNTAYNVAAGEHYEQFYYRAPWPTGTVGTRFGTKLDNKAIVHHWLLFSSAELDDEGTHRTAPLPTLLGVNATLLAGWAVGGTNLAMPEDVGFELPEQGTTLNIQWHFYNNAPTPQQDKSVVQVCTVPSTMRKNVATVTWIGNEDLNGNKWFGGEGMPPHQVSTFSGTCDPLREGMDPNEPIHILGFWPHMHQLGTRMQATINRVNGTQETIFDKKFDFNYQVHYMQRHELMPGDTLTATCTFNNTTDMGVPFGESTDTEMCYNFTFAYPAHALENHIPSLIGATNTCW
jgi:hypothetical protein